MLIRVGYEIAINCWSPTALVTMMSVHDERAPEVCVTESFQTVPSTPAKTYRDLFGNSCRRLVAPAGDLVLRADTVVEDDGLIDPWDMDAVQHDVADLPDDCLVYLMPSRYCEADSLGQMAWNLFGGIAGGAARAQAICDFAHGRLRFDYQNARATRTAAEGYEEQTGVCRDFAHLAIALCRAMNIPARYVNGYLPDIGVFSDAPMDFCAWAEVYLGGRWWTLDPRNNARRVGRIKIAQGRDAADVAMISSFGPHGLTRFEVWADQVASAPAAAA